MGMLDAIATSRPRFPLRLAADRRGAAAVEFALGAPLLIMVAVGLMEICSVLFASSLLEGGLREAARAGSTGYASESMTREEYIISIVEENTIGLIDLSAGDLSYKVYESFSYASDPREPWADSDGDGMYDSGETYTDVNGNGAWDPDMGVAGLGGTGDIVLYTIDYDWQLLTGFLSHLIGEGGTIPLRASTIVRNEPFDAGSPAAGGGT